jgi:hypothetical protein
MRGTADRTGRIDRCEDADIVAPTKELLGESFDVPVDAPLERPRIWRDKTYAHEHLRVDDGTVCI